MVYLTLLTLGWAVSSLYTHWQLRQFQQIDALEQVICSLELLHRTYLHTSTSNDYPQPREERRIVLRLFGLPVCQSRWSLGLPLQCDVRISRIDAQEFNQHFPEHFRLEGWQKHLHYPLAWLRTTPQSHTH